MECIILALLTEEFKNEHQDFIDEFTEHDGKIIPFAAGLNGNTFEEYIKTVRNLEKGIVDNPNWVGCHTYYLLRTSDNKYVGAISIRHKLNDCLVDFGHIAYGVRYSDRKSVV